MTEILPIGEIPPSVPEAASLVEVDWQDPATKKLLIRSHSTEIGNLLIKHGADIANRHGSNN